MYTLTSLTNFVGFGHTNPLQDSQPLLAASFCGSCRCSSCACVHAANCNPWCRCGEEILTRSQVHTQKVPTPFPRSHNGASSSGHPKKDSQPGLGRVVMPCKHFWQDQNRFWQFFYFCLYLTPCCYLCYIFNIFFKAEFFFQKYFCNSTG